MNREFNRLHYLIPAAYLFLIAGFIYLYFAQTGAKIETINGITVTSRNRTGTESHLLSRVEIRFLNMNFAFSQNHPLLLAEKDGRIIDEVLPLSYKASEEGVILEFSENISLHFSMPDETASLYMKADSLLQDKLFIIPYTLDHQYTLNSSDMLPFQVFEGPEKYYITHESESVLGSRSLEFAGDGCIRFEKDETGIVDPSLFWLEKDLVTVDTQQIGDMLDDYLAKALMGFTYGRYRSDGTWQTKDGTRIYSEQINSIVMAAGLSEDNAIWIRNARNAVVGRENNPNFVSVYSSAYFGNVVTNGLQNRMNVEADYRNIQSALENSDPGIFASENLITTLVRLEARQYLPALAKSGASLNIQEAEYSILLGFAETWLDAEEHMQGDQFRDRAWEILRFLLLRTTKQNGYLAVTDKNQQVDNYYTLRLALILKKAGDYGFDPEYAGFSSNMLAGILLVADEEGFIKRFPEISSNQEWITPESIYMKLTSFPYSVKFYFPEPASLPGVFLISGAVVTEKSSLTTNRFNLMLEYKVGERHHLVIENIDRPVSLKLHGTEPWPMDRAFQAYHTGWYYSDTERTFYLKLRQDDPIEEVILKF